MSITLRYCRFPADLQSFCASVRTEKVFPVASIEEVDYLKRLARLYMADVEEVKPPAARPETDPPTDQGRGSVMCLDPVLFPAASLYAALSDRHARCSVSDVRGLDGCLGDVEVLIFPWSCWTTELAFALNNYRHDPFRRAIGLIPAHDLADAFRQATRRTAALFLSQDPPHAAAVSRIGVLANFPARSAGGGTLSLLGRDADPSLLTDALGCGADLLCIDTHSDGIDSPLPGGRLLCSLKGRERPFVGVEPVCVASRVCHRSEHRPLDEALGSDQLVSTSDLSAKVLFYRACSVMQPARDGLDPRDTLGHALFDQSVCGCIVTSADEIFSIDLAILQEIGLIAESSDVASAIARLADLKANDATRPRYFCFGDPRLLISRRQRPDVACEQRIANAPLLTSSTPGGGSSASEDGAAVMLVAMRDCNMAPLIAPEDWRRASKAWQAVLEFIEHPIEEVGDEPRSTIEDLFAACLPFVRREPVNAWMLVGAQWAETPNTKCTNCGFGAQGLACTLAGSAHRRNIINCAICGISQDRPEWLNVTVHISEEGELTLIDMPRKVKLRYFVRIHVHQKQGPATFEVQEELLRRGYRLVSPLLKAMRAQVSVFTLTGPNFAVNSRNVTLFPADTILHTR